MSGKELHAKYNKFEQHENRGDDQPTASSTASVYVSNRPRIMVFVMSASHRLLLLPE
jgi:hypothetical protein